MTTEQWLNLKEGDIIYSKKTGQPRKILKYSTPSECITLQKLGSRGTTVYCKGDRPNFTLTNETMNKEELMAYAIKMYPIGTKYHPVNSYEGTVIISMTYEVRETPKWSGDVLCANGNLYAKGVWATVISYPEGFVPESKIINNYSIY